MELSKAERLSLYSVLKNELSSYTAPEIDNGIMLYCLADYGCDTSLYDSKAAATIAQTLAQYGMSTGPEAISEFFESLLEDNHKDNKGIVFTPKYIAEYIASTALVQKKTDLDKTLIIDPGCGCGIFLIAAAEFLLSATNKEINSIIEENIFGIDIVEANVHRCKLILQLLSAKHGGKYESVKPNIICKDSLKTNWSGVFHIDAFDYIIGNPPYLNTHDLDKETAQYLKKTFKTTQSGVFNIFYAFIEKGMEQLHPNGILSFIIPNNFLTIKSATELRKQLQVNSSIKRILDLGENMVFKPIRTYNCIIQLSKESNTSFEYCVLSKTDNIERAVNQAEFSRLAVDSLDKHGWKLVDEQTLQNLRKIENQSVSIKSFIRTGIATLKDSLYLVEKDDSGYFKTVKEEKLRIESDLVKPIYKVPELKLCDNIEDTKRYIIFPYVKSDTGYTLIDEQAFSERYPQTYACLLMQRDQLDARDKGKGAAQGWYAYGRTQGLNKYGKKLLFPTFAEKPKFILVPDDDALFCNGYAVFENELYDLDILSKILNSRLMEYYVSNTSYSIEGGYYCYQKNMLSVFRYPFFQRKNCHIFETLQKRSLTNICGNFTGWNHNTHI